MKEIYFEELRTFLLSLTYEDFKENKIIKNANAEGEVDINLKDSDSEIIKYGEYFLVDALGNDLTILKLSKRNYKLPTGRVVRGKFIKTIIKDCREVFGSCLNGYWAIPKKYLRG